MAAALQSVLWKIGIWVSSQGVWLDVNWMCFMRSLWKINDKLGNLVLANGYTLVFSPIVHFLSIFCRYNIGKLSHKQHWKKRKLRLGYSENKLIITWSHCMGGWSTLQSSWPGPAPQQHPYGCQTSAGRTCWPQAAAWTQTASGSRWTGPVRVLCHRCILHPPCWCPAGHLDLLCSRHYESEPRRRAPCSHQPSSLPLGRGYQGGWSSGNHFSISRSGSCSSYGTWMSLVCELGSGRCLCGHLYSWRGCSFL